MPDNGVSSFTFDWLPILERGPMSLFKDNFEEWLERLRPARERRDEKAFERRCKREDDADRMIGELCREGRKVFYAFPQGGRYREGTKQDLREFLIRNNYA